jgi:preprotein translocase subunit SecE
MATNPVVFLKEVRSELGKVIWPSKNEAIRLTSLVVGISLGVGFFIGAFDFLFTKMMEAFLK